VQLALSSGVLRRRGGQALAARSAGRAGGRSGFSSRAAAPRAAPQRSAAAPNVTNVVVAPPMFSPFGGFGYGFSPFGFGFGMPVRSSHFATIAIFPPFSLKSGDERKSKWCPHAHD
jgi:hypothetical protein